MKCFLILSAILYFGQGTVAQSSCPGPLLGCELLEANCNNGRGKCKDCCDSEQGEVEMNSAECSGQCKCCGLPCPVPDCNCPTGQHPETAINLDTGCELCHCVPDICPAIAPLCGCPPQTVTEEYIDESTGCLTCRCVRQTPCPEPLCRCGSDQNVDYFIMDNGCRNCRCVPRICPVPFCVCDGTLQPVLLHPEVGCPQCGCVEPQPCPRVPRTCFCAPNERIEEFVQDVSGCPDCRCVQTLPEPCPVVDCPVCLANEEPVFNTNANGCPFCSCAAVEPQQCPLALCRCALTDVVEEFIQENGCAGCRCVPVKQCPVPFCVCDGPFTPIEVIDLEDGCPTCSCVPDFTPVACPGGLCKTNCNWPAGEFVGPFNTCPANQFCCNSPENASCGPRKGSRCGSQCTCRALCERGEYSDGFCESNVQDVAQCKRCKTCPEDPTCTLGCPGGQLLQRQLDERNCLECQCGCPLIECNSSCERTLDPSTGCFRCSC